MTDPEPLFARGIVQALTGILATPPTLVAWGDAAGWPGPAGAAIVGMLGEGHIDVVVEAVASRTPTLVLGADESLLGAGVRAVLPRDCQPVELVRAVKTISRRNSKGAQKRPDEPTARELEVISLLAKGMTNREIAGELFISEHTVRNHVGHLFGKLGVNSRTQAVLQAGQLGWLRLPG